jgi:hypothetical protein
MVVFYGVVSGKVSLSAQCARRSRDVNYEQFINKLEKARTQYTLFRYYTATYVEVGRFPYRFDEQGNFQGGWIKDCYDDWRPEAEKWLALLNEPVD